MRHTLKAARKTAGKIQKEIATAIGISERYYQDIELGVREGKSHIWDSLEAFFEHKIHQRELRRNTQWKHYSSSCVP